MSSFLEPEAAEWETGFLDYGDPRGGARQPFPVALKFAEVYIRRRAAASITLADATLAPRALSFGRPVWSFIASFRAATGTDAAALAAFLEWAANARNTFALSLAEHAPGISELQADPVIFRALRSIQGWSTRDGATAGATLEASQVFDDAEAADFDRLTARDGAWQGGALDYRLRRQYLIEPASPNWWGDYSTAA